MKTDYKLWYVARDDNGFITEVAVRFFEGEVTTQDERHFITKELRPITRYRRTKRLQAGDLKHFPKKARFKKDGAGNDARIYGTSEFGAIKTDEELLAFLDKELAKDKGRQPVEEQKAKQ